MDLKARTRVLQAKNLLTTVEGVITIDNESPKIVPELSYKWLKRVYDLQMCLKSNFLQMPLYNSNCCPLSNIYSCNDNYLCKPETNIVQICNLEYSVTSLVTSLNEGHSLCGYDYGESLV